MTSLVIFRSSRPEVFRKKDVLRNFRKFTEKHLCQSLFFNNRVSSEYWGMHIYLNQNPRSKNEIFIRKEQYRSVWRSQLRSHHDCVNTIKKIFYAYLSFISFCLKDVSYKKVAGFTFWSLPWIFWQNTRSLNWNRNKNECQATLSSDKWHPLIIHTISFQNELKTNIALKVDPAGIYLLKFHYSNIRTRCEICSK